MLFITDMCKRNLKKKIGTADKKVEKHIYQHIDCVGLKPNYSSKVKKIFRQEMSKMNSHVDFIF